MSIARYEEARRALSDLLIKEDKYWRQRAKIFWLKDGDMNTKFFHRMASARRRRNRIEKLQNSDGVWVDSQSGLNVVVLDYFGSLFQANTEVSDIESILQCVQPCIKNEDNAYLVSNFSRAEFKIVVSQMHPDKSPVPDGFNPVFYQKFWSIVGEEIFSACTTWLKEGRFPQHLNDTCVTLIPKCDTPTSMKDLRPISLCNVVYKILSKVLCNRMKSVMPDLVDKSQSAFVAGRSIQDNILIAFELIHSMKKKVRGKIGDMALKIDISKAYDRVNWTYLELILKKLGFYDTWRRWVMMCVTTVRYSFKVNDEIVGPIQPGRGLRQGDPLSPYLFILCAEGLSALMRRANRQGRLHGGKVCRNSPMISHLLFADDCLFFCRANVHEANALKEVLHIYGKMSGQAINFSKSGTFFSKNVEDGVKTEIADILGVHQSLNTGRYLGLPSLIGRGKREVFAYIRERLWSRLHLWKNKKISKAGKEILIKAAAQAIPTYCMSVFLLPSTLIDELHTMLNKFWWSNDS